MVCLLERSLCVRKLLDLVKRMAQIVPLICVRRIQTHSLSKIGTRSVKLFHFEISSAHSALWMGIAGIQPSDLLKRLHGLRVALRSKISGAQIQPRWGRARISTKA